jgi:hypothetical protein
MNHYPKGGMCATCRHTMRDCSHLDFAAMPVLSRACDAVIVRCTDFESSKSQTVENSKINNLVEKITKLVI